MNPDKGVELNQEELSAIMLLIILKDRAGIQRVLEQYKISSIQHLLWRKESIIFCADFDNFKWLNCPEDFDINVRNAMGRTLLFSILRDAGTFGELLKRNIDVNIHDEKGCSAVMFYATLGYTYKVCELLDCGASLKEAKEGYSECVVLKSNMLDHFKQYEQRETSCRKSVAGFTLMGKVSKGTIHKDLIPMISNLVWFTRRREEWE